MSLFVLPLAALLLSGATAIAAKPAPVVTVSPPSDLTKGGKLQTEGSYLLGPTGARGRMYVKAFMTREARQILISEIEKGSPADGVLEVGDVILGIGDKPFSQDARKGLGRAINQAETEKNKGVLKLLRWRSGKKKTVSLQLKVLGSFSDTAPYNCPKSKRIMDDALRYLAARKKWSRFSLEALAFLASGRPEYVDLVKKHIHQARWAGPDAKCGNSAWGAGYIGMVLTEYYLATGDKYVLPAIREYAVKTAMGQGAPGTWGHHFVPPDKYGRLHGRIMGYGGLNSAGLPCFLALVLARKCGVKHPEVDMAIERSNRFFSQFVGRGSIGYGFHRPSLERRSNGRNALSSNGKNGNAAVIYTVLADRKVSRYFSKLVTSSYDEREYGHSGNSYSIFWGAPGANCGGPKATAAFLKELRWYSALTRKADGSFVTQPLGGYYGGRGALDATVAHVLANALPLRKIHLTGKGASSNFQLNDAEVKEAIDSGRWRWANYDKITGDELIARLGSWSTSAREWIAEGLGGKKGNFTPKLLKLLKSDDPCKRAGACTALGYQGERAAAAVGALSKALSDEDSRVRVAASYALSRIGKPGRKALPDMLRAVVRTKETQSMQPTQTAIAYSIGHDSGRTAPLYLTGMFHNWPKGDNPLKGLDRKVLYPAITKLLRDSSARVRGCGAYAFQYLNAEDVAVLASDIYEISRNVAPHYPMFGDIPRQRGVDLMARYHLSEGLDLCLETLKERGWGGSARIVHRFEVLQKYRGAAKSVLGELKALRWNLRKPETRSLLEEAIKTVEGDKDPPKLASLADLVDRRLDRELSSVKSKKQRTDLCRKLIEDHPGDHFLRAAVLKRLVSLIGAGAFDDLLAAVDHPDERLSAAAVKLAAGLPGKDVIARFAAQLAKARGEKIAGILNVLARRGDKKMLPVMKKHLKHDEEIVRAAAAEGAAAIGGAKAIGVLVDFLVKAEGPRERISAEKAVVAACRNAAPVLAALDKTKDNEAAHCSLIRVLGQIGGAKALAAVADAAADDKNANICKIAADVLASSPDPKATDVLLALGEKIRRGRSRSNIISACLRRVINGRTPAGGKLGLLAKIAELDGRGFGARTALEELAWSPSPASLTMARSWMAKKDKKRYGNINEYAARAAVAIAQRMNVSDRKQRTAAVKAVKEALAITKHEETTAAAKAFIAKHDK